MAKAASTTRTGRGKGKAPELVAQSDPQAALDGALFLKTARPVLAKLAADLLERAQGSPGVQAALAARHAAEVEDKRTGDTFALWQRRYVGQVADAWLLSCVFVRTLEDRGLLGRNRLAGPGAVDSQKLFLELAPSLTERDYLLMVFRELARFPAARSLFDPHHNPVWKLAPSAEGAKELLQLFRTPDAGSPGFRFGQTDTRFLGDLYQDLDEEVRERYALLQTPRFVESFILDRTLEPAIERFGLDDTNLIDPTCGSGHFLLGAFERLCDDQLRKNPGLRVAEAADRALEAVAGTDINPYAVAIAKFRLTLAYVEKVGLRRLKDAPELKLNVAVADSLLQVSTQIDFADRPGQKAAVWRGEELALEDEEEAKAVLGRQYGAVVGNPPYITVKDPVKRIVYRQMYASAFREYSLAAPFAERFFQLGRSGALVGMITANSFTKREFGKVLIEQVLPRINLTCVLNTAGAHLPGHGTPTVLLFGTAEEPQGDEIRCVLGKRGEPSTPDDASQGLVWRSVADHWNEVGFENDFITVSQTTRSSLSKHPWSLGGGGANDLKALLDESSAFKLSDIAGSIGFCVITGEDNVLSQPADVWRRVGVTVEHTRRLGIGEEVRDWAVSSGDFCAWPCDEVGQRLDTAEISDLLRFLWPYRRTLQMRKAFGVPVEEKGIPWWALREVYKDRLRTPLTIAFAFVATHNHFVLDRGGKVFKQSAPIIKLPETATEEDYVAVLAYLNSSTACFWMKQVAMSNGGSGIGRGIQDEAWESRFQFDVSKMKMIPLPRGLPPHLGAAMCELSSARREGASPADGSLPGNGDLHAWRDRDLILLGRMVALQEEVDWLTYEQFGLLTPKELEEHRRARDEAWPGLESRMPDNGAHLLPGRRPFEVNLRERSRLNSRSTAWFERNRYWDDDDAVEQAAVYRRLLEVRLRIARENPNVGLIEQPEYKRRWTVRDHAAEFAEAERRARLAQLEDAVRRSSVPQTRRDIVGGFVGSSGGVEDRDLLDREAVPHLAALRFTIAGCEKLGVWERTWSAQRLEDEGTSPGQIDVPPPYDKGDFADAVFWALRGKLDVPKERFISYPGCESDQDGQPVYGWAGWDHLQRAQALTALYQRRKTEEAWGKERLTPMLAGLLELIPWVKQWYNEPSEEFGGLRLGEYFETFLAGECAELGLTMEDLRVWRPSAKGKTGRMRAGAVGDEGDDLSTSDGPSSRPSPRAAGRGRKKKAAAIVQESPNDRGDADQTIIAAPESES